MHWKFEEILSISVFHQDTEESPPLDFMGYIPEFTLIPSAKTRSRFGRLGWYAKPFKGGLTVFAEKIVRADGTAFLKGKAKQNEAFEFFLKLTRPDILNKTAPFVKKENNKAIPNDDLPAFSGKNRLLYFDNLNAENIGTLDKPVYRLTLGDYANLAELGSRATTPFVFPLESGNTSNVTATAINPGAVEDPKSFGPKAGAKAVVLDLEENAWTINQEPSGTSEVLYLTRKAIPSDVFGVIRIFNTEAIPLTAFRRFKALFARA